MADSGDQVWSAIRRGVDWHACGDGPFVRVVLLQLREGNASIETIVRSLAKSDGRWALATLACVVGYSLVDKVGMERFARASELSPALRGPLYFALENAMA
ncbi:MAG: hypothetical protein OEZ06_31745 [Myxococcales bacterium]|nr:hypothetical protein [Myxococcales bacterium]